MCTNDGEVAAMEMGFQFYNQNSIMVEEVQLKSHPCSDPGGDEIESVLLC